MAGDLELCEVMYSSDPKTRVCKYALFGTDNPGCLTPSQTLPPLPDQQLDDDAPPVYVCVCVRVCVCAPRAYTLYHGLIASRVFSISCVHC